MPTPVKLHHVPRWLRDRIHRRVGLGYDIHDVNQRMNADLGYPHWLDHWGSTNLPSGETAFVSEPYGLDGPGMQAVLRFADALGLSVRIEAATEWNPAGGTIRIVLTPRDQA